MQPRDLFAFLVGTAIFVAVPLSDFVPLLDPVLSERRENTMLFVYVEFSWAAAAGATVVFVAGRPGAWGAAVASALAGNVVWALLYEAALKPPSRGGFEAAPAVTDALFVFLSLHGPAATVGAMLAALALGLINFLRGLLRRRRGVG